MLFRSNLLTEIPQTRVLRDPTRGGLSSTLNEIALSSNVSLEIDENKLPISSEVSGICELLGLDPLYVANEGIMLAFVPEEFADQALSIIKNSEHGANAQIIGKAVKKNERSVWLNRSFGGKRPIEMITGEQLPRIC